MTPKRPRDPQPAMIGTQGEAIRRLVELGLKAKASLPPAGNNGTGEAFALHAKRSVSFDLGSRDGVQRGNRSGSAYANDATGSNGPASAREECDGLRADAIDAATRHHRAAGHHDC